MRREYKIPEMNMCTRHYSCEKYVSVLLLALVFIFSSCWDKQDIPIIPAPVPVYTLSGIIRDIDTGNPVTGIPIELFNSSTAYTGYDTTLYDTTDDSGQYEFFELVSPGFVYFYAFRDSYQVHYDELVMEWKDKQYNVNLPKLALAEIYSVGPPEGNVGGIVWKDAATLAIIDTWEDLPIGIDSLNVFTKIYESVSGGSFERISDDMLEPNNRIYNSLDFYGEYYVATSSPIWVIINKDTVLWEGSYYHLNSGNQTIVGTPVPLPVSSESIRDVAVNVEDVFLAAGHNLIRWNPAQQDTFVIFDSLASYIGITVSDSSLFVYDGDVASQFLIELDEEFNSINTYIIMIKHKYYNPLAVTGYLTVDKDNNLWTFGGYQGTTRIFKVVLIQ